MTRTIGLATGAVAVLLLVACGEGGVDEEARDTCEDEFGVGNCVERDSGWVPLASATTGSTSSSTTTTSTSRPTTTTSTTLATTTTIGTRGLTGTMRVGHDGWLVKDDNCANGSFDGYPDMRVGSPVTVKNASGAVVATGRVERAEWVNRQDKSDSFGSYTTAGCLLHWSVPAIPLAGEFISVNVGSERRGYVNYSRTELDSAGWSLGLTV